MEIKNINLKPSRDLIRAKTTITIWARENGFNYQTVVKVLNNFSGKRRIGVALEIVEKLKADGFYAEAAEEKAA